MYEFEESERVTKSGSSWLVGLLVVALLVVGGAAAFFGWRTLDTGNDTSSAAPAAGNGEAAAGESAADDPTQTSDQSTEMIVWLDVGVAQQQVAAIDGVLADHPAVLNYRYLDQDETYADFEAYFSDEPEIQALVEPEQLPTSFRVNIVNVSEGGFIAELETVAGVDEVEIFVEPQDRTPILTGQVEYLVWLDAGVTDAQIEATDRALAQHPQLVSYRYIDIDQTFEEFQEYFAEEPEILDLVTPEQLPTNFEVTLELGADQAVGAQIHEAFIAEIESIDGVDAVEHKRQYESEN